MTTMKLKLLKIGEEIGIILPQEAPDMLGVREGDNAYLVPVPGGYRISRAEPEDHKI